MNPRAIEAGARAIARHIPLDAGSTWNPGYGEDFPLNYSDKECAAIRAIAEMAITAYEAHLKAEGFVVVRADPTEAMLKDGAMQIAMNAQRVMTAERKAWYAKCAMLSAATTGENNPLPDGERP
jgi:hypothetical protein